MAEWKRHHLEDDGASALEVTVAGGESPPLRVMGAPLSVQVAGGPVDVLGRLSPTAAFLPLNDLQMASLTTRSDCVEGVAERVYEVQVVGRGTVTILAVGRRL